MSFFLYVIPTQTLQHYHIVIMLFPHKHHLIVIILFPHKHNLIVNMCFPLKHHLIVIMLFPLKHHLIVYSLKGEITSKGIACKIHSMKTRLSLSAILWIAQCICQDIFLQSLDSIFLPQSLFTQCVVQCWSQYIII